MKKNLSAWQFATTTAAEIDEIVETLFAQFSGKDTAELYDADGDTMTVKPTLKNIRAAVSSGYQYPENPKAVPTTNRGKRGAQEITYQEATQIQDALLRDSVNVPNVFREVGRKVVAKILTWKKRTSTNSGNEYSITCCEAEGQKFAVLFDATTDKEKGAEITLKVEKTEASRSGWGFARD